MTVVAPTRVVGPDSGDTLRALCMTGRGGGEIVGSRGMAAVT
jgi:hypothetical protein